MSTETDVRDRVIRLEEQFKYMSEKQDDTNDKVTALHELLLQGKGAAWGFKLLWVALAGIVGAVGLKLASLLPWLSIPPR